MFLFCSMLSASAQGFKLSWNQFNIAALLLRLAYGQEVQISDDTFRQSVPRALPMGWLTNLCIDGDL